MSQLLVDEFPIALPKLCVQVRVITPKDKPISKLTVRAVMLDKIIATVTPDINNDTSQHLPEELSFTESSVMMIFSPLSITEPGSLRIEAEVDGEVLQGGILLLRKRPPTTEAIN